jgi:hypothetical protein
MCKASDQPCEALIQLRPSGAMVAQPTCNRQVTGSNPVSGSPDAGAYSTNALTVEE